MGVVVRCGSLMRGGWVVGWVAWGVGMAWDRLWVAGRVGVGGWVPGWVTAGGRGAPTLGLGVVLVGRLGWSGGEEGVVLVVLFRRSRVPASVLRLQPASVLGTTLTITCSALEYNQMVVDTANER